MKKIINILLLVLVILSWRKISADQEKEKMQFDHHINKADQYFQMQADIDAYEEYEKSEKYAKADKLFYVTSQKLKILLRQDEFLTARKLIDGSNLTADSLEKLSLQYLHACLSNERFSDMNTFIENYRTKINLSHFENEICTKYVDLGQFDRVDQIGDDMFLVSDQDRQVIIDKNARRLFTSYFDKLIGFDEENKLVTVKDKGENILFDFKKNIRAKLNGKNINHFKGDSYILAEDKYHLKNQLNETLLEADYISELTDEKRFVVRGKDLEILDEDNKILEKISLNSPSKEAKAYEIRSDIAKIKDGDVKLYNLKNKKFSMPYQDIELGREGYIAVKKENKWAYIDDSFKELTGFIYEQAKGFSNGLGLVQIKEKKYFIDSNFKILKEVGFDDFKNFNNNGVAFIKENNKWHMIRLIRKVR
ncbi:MAG: WG repeat-containing protein [Tissierellia bacterium]|nr:WG repeat-containing protein [Tissierellia bacterium]